MELHDLLLLRAYFDASTVDLVASEVTADHFTDPNRRLLAEVLSAMFTDGETITTETVTTRLVAAHGDTREEANRRVDQIMAEDALPFGEVESLIKSVAFAVDISLRTELGNWLLSDQSRKASSEKAWARIQDYATKSALLDQDDFRTAADGLREAMDTPEPAIYHTLDLGDLDDTFRIHPHSFNIIMAESGSGKSSMMLNGAYNLAKKGVRSYIFSIEMDFMSVMYRLAGMACGISCNAIEEKRLTPTQREHIEYTLKANNHIFSLIYVDSPGALIAEGVHSKINRLVRKHGDGIIWIDYLQSVEALVGKNDTTVDSQSKASKILTRAAKVTGQPIVALSQITPGATGAERIKGAKQAKHDAWSIMELYRGDRAQEVAEEATYGAGVVRLYAKQLKGRKDGVYMRDVALRYNLITQRIEAE